MGGSPDIGGLGDVVLYDAPRPAAWRMNGPLGQRHDWQAQPEEFRFTQGPVFASLRATGAIGPHVIRREVRLWAKSRRIEYSIEIDAKDGLEKDVLKGSRWLLLKRPENLDLSRNEPKRL